MLRFRVCVCTLLQAVTAHDESLEEGFTTDTQQYSTGMTMLLYH
jgi:hypothetical protein